MSIPLRIACLLSVLAVAVLHSFELLSDRELSVGVAGALVLALLTPIVETARGIRTAERKYERISHAAKEAYRRESEVPKEGGDER